MHLFLAQTTLSFKNRGSVCTWLRVPNPYTAIIPIKIEICCDKHPIIRAQAQILKSMAHHLYRDLLSIVVETKDDCQGE